MDYISQLSVLTYVSTLSEYSFVTKIRTASSTAVNLSKFSKKLTK